MSVVLGSNVTYSCGNGGTLTTLGVAEDLTKTGIENGWAVYDDIHINAYDDMTIDVAEEKTKATVKRVAGEVVVTFGLTSRVPNGKADIEVRNLAPDEWYRLQFDGVLAKTDGGRAHGKSSANGELIFNSVHVPE